MSEEERLKPPIADEKVAAEAEFRVITAQTTTKEGDDDVINGQKMREWLEPKKTLDTIRDHSKSFLKIIGSDGLMKTTHERSVWDVENHQSMNDLVDFRPKLTLLNASFGR